MNKWPALANEGCEFLGVASRKREFFIITAMRVLNLLKMNFFYAERVKLSSVDLLLNGHHNVGKVIQMNQLDATITY